MQFLLKMVLTQDAIYPFTEAMFQGISTVLFNFGSTADRARFLFHKNGAADDQGLFNLAAEQIFTNVRAASGMQFLVHTSMFQVRKDKVVDLLSGDRLVHRY